MGASGNTAYVLQSLDPETGQLMALPGMPSGIPEPDTLAGSILQGLLPRDLAFSPNGETLAWSTYFSLNVCEGGGGLALADADGANLRIVDVPALADSLAADPARYQVIDDLHWFPGSLDLVVAGRTYTCPDGIGEPQVDVAGVWRLAPDGSATVVADVPTRAFSLSPDGAWIALEVGAQPDTQLLVYALAGSDITFEAPGARQPQFAP